MPVLPNRNPRRVLVTGSGRGIGKAIAFRFAAQGDRVYLTARTAEELEATQRELVSVASEVRSLALDLTLPETTTKLVEEVRQAWGGLDVLVTNAGAAPQDSFLELTDTDWPNGFSLKLFANVRVIKQA